MVLWSTSLLHIASLCFFINTSPSNSFQATTSRGTHTSISLATESNHDSTKKIQTAALLENAKEIDSSLASGNAVGDFCESTWSNRYVCDGGLMILPLESNTIYVPCSYRDFCIKIFDAS